MVVALPPPEQHDGQRLVLSGIPWRSYLRIGDELQQHSRVRLSYQRGSLEFMTISTLHDRYKKWLGQFVIILAEELNRPLLPNGSMTFRSEVLERGFEPDECFWIEHEAAMRDVEQWQYGVHPAPDLLLEIELSQSFVDRLEIAEAIEVGEVWRFDGDELRVWQRQADGTYRSAEQSRWFPEVDLRQLLPFLDLTVHNNFLETMRQFRQWVRVQLQAGKGR